MFHSVIDWYTLHCQEYHNLVYHRISEFTIPCFECPNHPVLLIDFHYRCSLAEECSDYGSALKWMAYNGKTCTKITQVYPDKIQRDNNLAKTTTVKTILSVIDNHKLIIVFKMSKEKQVQTKYFSLHYRYH